MNTSANVQWLAKIQKIFPVIQVTNTYYMLVRSCGLEVNHSSFVTKITN